MTPEQLAKRILELDPDPAAIELAAHLKRQFDVGFNAGLEAARKYFISQSDLLEEMREVYPGDPDGQLGKDAEQLRAIAEELSALSVRTDLIAVPRDCRLWKYHVMPMPINKEGHGPATIGEDAVRIEYEVWKADLIQSIASFEYLPDAINRAMIAATEERG